MDEDTKIISQSNTAQRLGHVSKIIFDACLVALIVLGISFRFSWVNWSQGTNLHPDEYGLTNTLTQLSIPKNIADYFNTRISPLSPYQKYDLSGNVTANGPDNRMRWGQLPLSLIRLAGELSGNAGYDEIRLLGRNLSALADTLTILLIFLIGKKLYKHRIGLLAAALSALSVMQIQQSHFMTVDNFGGFFTTLALFTCVHIASLPPVRRKTSETVYRISTPSIWVWYLVFGISFGMALACKVNLLPVGGMVLIGAFISIADLKLKSQVDLKHIFGSMFILLFLAFFTAAITFRVTQPMSFRASSGDTSIITLYPNQDWVDSMKVASAESSGEGGGPPGEQWAHRLAIIFPLTNMVLWGMGLPLGLAAWLGFGWAFWQVISTRKNWRMHLLPLVWAGGYFLFMGTRWVKSIRYFLPIYPFLCLFAAWGLLELMKWACRKENARGHPLRILFSSSLICLVLIGTLAWSNAFIQAVYQTNHTRIQATRWIFQNIPGPIHLELTQADGTKYYEPLAMPNNLMINVSTPYILEFTAPTNGQLTQAVLPRILVSVPSSLKMIISSDRATKNILGQSQVDISSVKNNARLIFQNINFQLGNTYYLNISSPSQAPITISRVMIANESWDEGLPVRFDNKDPFGQLYNGTTMEVRWPDDEHKRVTLLSTLAEVDYLILPSQRAIWSICRIPETYPMTMAYYRALFDGRLGFEQVAAFSSPFKLGPVRISDVGGNVSWNKDPTLPLFNHNWMAAEEAFSVYDHPPVWIFKKRADFNIETAKTILGSVDLKQVVVQSAPNASGDWCPAQ